jgi:SAM-dependent methyltransferase
MTESSAPFDQPHALRINEARRKALEDIVALIRRNDSVRSAIDVGCGFGMFSSDLRGLGLDVVAVDVREENVTEARRRHGQIHFVVANIEDPAIIDVGRFDIVLCFGLLYHLENPFAAIRHLEKLTGGTLVLESVCIPGSSPEAMLIEEQRAADQALRYIALVPSESWLIKTLYASGFPFVHRLRRVPDHADFKPSLLKKRMRTLLVASHRSLEGDVLAKVSEPAAGRYVWDRAWTRLLLGSEKRRRTVTAIVQRAVGRPNS